MLSQDLFEADWIISRIQARIGTFLTLKDKIVKIKDTTLDLNVKSEAEGLLQTQKELEDQLSEGLKTIDKIKAGAYSISDIINLGYLYYSIEKQIKDVSELETKWAGAPKEEGLSSTQKLILAAVAGGLIYYWIKK
jgi:hypothetical protein